MAKKDPEHPTIEYLKTKAEKIRQVAENPKINLDSSEKRWYREDIDQFLDNILKTLESL